MVEEGFNTTIDNRLKNNPSPWFDIPISKTAAQIGGCMLAFTWQSMPNSHPHAETTDSASLTVIPRETRREGNVDAVRQASAKGYHGLCSIELRETSR